MAFHLFIIILACIIDNKWEQKAFTTNNKICIIVHLVCLLKTCQTRIIARTFSAHIKETCGKP
jgi:hypothetical protein